LKISWIFARKGRLPVGIAFHHLRKIEKPESGSAAFRRKKTAIGDAIGFWLASYPVFFVPAEALLLPRAALRRYQARVLPVVGTCPPVVAEEFLWFSGKPRGPAPGFRAAPGGLQALPAAVALVVEVRSARWEYRSLPSGSCLRRACTCMRGAGMLS